VSFVGREPDLEILEERLAASRLVTVLGPPGVGKSALVAEAARSRALADKVVRVECEARFGVRELGEALLTAAGLSGRVPQMEEQAELEAYVRLVARGRRNVIVFDDADACLPLVARYVSACLELGASARCVVTSRERLRLGGESVVFVDPLPLPDETDDPDEAVLAPSVQLLVERARAADGRFRLTRQNTRAVTALVRALEGLPLSIVSFAGRFSAVGATELARQAERRVGLFSANETDTRGRARSLEAAMEASWLALPEALRECLAALSVFGGAFGLEGAMAVLDRDDEPRARASVQESLEALVDRSLLRLARFEEPRRYTMLRAVRELARERLEEGGRARAVAVALVRRLAELPRPVSFGDPRAADFDPLTYEQAFHTAREVGEAERAARLLLALGTHYLRRGPLGAYTGHLSAVLAGGDTLPAHLRAELHLDRGLAQILGGAREASRADFEAAARLGAPEIAAVATSKLGLAVGLGGGYDEARRHFAAARAMLAGRGSSDVEGRIHKDAANVFSEEGSEEAHAALVAARACFVRSGNLRERAFVELLLAARLCDEGKLHPARKMAERLVDELAQIGDERSLAWTYTVAGLTEQELGRFSVARERYTQALDVTRRVGDVHTEGLVLAYLAGLELEMGEAHQAVLRGGEAIHALDAAGERHGKAMVLAVVGCGYAALGHRRLSERAIAEAREAVSEGGRPARVVAVDLLALAALGEEDGRRQALLATAPLTEEVRFALRCLDRTASSAVPAPDRRDRREVVVADDGGWIRGPDGQTLDLTKRPVLRRLVHALTREREKSPGKAVSSARLVRHVWPNEKILERAAMNRLYVAVTRLRDEGLSDAIVRTNEGYLLSPDLGFRRGAAAPE